MSKGGSAPAAPDYTAAAKATAEGNLKQAQYTTAANRVNQQNPFGNIQFSQTTDAQGNPVWNAQTNLSPEQQKLLDYQTQSSLGLGGIQNQLGQEAQQTLSTPFDQSQLPAAQINPGQTAQDAIMSRLNPQFDRQQQQLETKLANQGIAPGTEAWKNAQYDLNTARNDAMSQAALQGIGVGQQARQQAIGEQSFFRNQPLQELSAVRGLAAPQMPSFGSVPQQAQTPGADILGAQNAQYNAQLGGYNASQAQNANFNSGLMNAALMYMLM